MRRVTIPDEADDYLAELSAKTGTSKKQLIVEALGLYEDASLGVLTSEPLPEPGHENEQEYIYFNGLVTATIAGLAFGKSWHTLDRWDKEGLFSEVNIYRGVRNPLHPRYYSPQNLRDMAHILYGAGRMDKAALGRTLLRIQQLFVIQRARRNLWRMKKERHWMRKEPRSSASSAEGKVS